MAERTGIEWTDATFNPWIGCTKVSPGCANCYAETRDKRWNGGTPIHWGPGAPRQRTTTWAQPRAWNKKAEATGRRVRVFCASLADVFDAEIPPEWRADLWRLIRETPKLDWQLLTKRPENILSMLPPDWGHGYSNVWLGTTTEDQKRADERIPLLTRVPAAVRFLSCEPLLGPISFRPQADNVADMVRLMESGDAARPALLDGIHWVIAGGESGPGARAMHPDWARSIRDQCVAAGVPFFFKQWGEFADPDHTSVPRDAAFGLNTIHWIEPSGARVGSDKKGPNACMMFRFGKKANGRELDGRYWSQFPRTRHAEVAA